MYYNILQAACFRILTFMLLYNFTRHTVLINFSKTASNLPFIWTTLFLASNFNKFHKILLNKKCRDRLRIKSKHTFIPIYPGFFSMRHCKDQLVQVKLNLNLTVPDESRHLNHLKITLLLQQRVDQITALMHRLAKFDPLSFPYVLSDTFGHYHLPP